MCDMQNAGLTASRCSLSFRKVSNSTMVLFIKQHYSTVQVGIGVIVAPTTKNAALKYHP